KLNMSDALVFNTEKQLKEYGDKLPEENKTEIEAAVAKLKEAHASKDLSAIDTAMEELNAVWTKASEHIYKAGAEAEGGAPTDGAASADSNDEGHVDADYEEVKE